MATFDVGILQGAQIASIARTKDNRIKIAEIRSAGRKRGRLYLLAPGDIQMRIAVRADDGDEVSITADVVSAEQALVTLQLENPIYGSVAELEAVTLTIDRARELAWALLSVADAVEFVSTPVTEVLSALNYPGNQTIN